MLWRRADVNLVPICVVLRQHMLSFNAALKKMVPKVKTAPWWAHQLLNCKLSFRKDPGPNFLQAYTAIIIDLQANPLKDDLANTFRGFTQLQTLILPQDVPCPGGSNAWDNVTSFKDKQICQGQRDLCNSTGSPEMCPENGSCASDGPGLLQCVCADGFHGYKCMRQGSFSLLMFFGILGSTTLAISILLWGTQRRKAKASWATQDFQLTWLRTLIYQVPAMSQPRRFTSLTITGQWAELFKAEAAIDNERCQIAPPRGSCGHLVQEWTRTNLYYWLQ